MNQNLIFVYGTLKRGGKYHHYLIDQKFVSTGRTTAEYTLYQSAGYPAMVRDGTDSEGVLGELWSVSTGCLEKLDQLEGVHEKLYVRTSVSLAPPHTHLKVETYIYLRPIAGYPHVGSTWH